ncbi:MAG TPA: peptidylprolyl isomerase [Candidatus Krumholzibacteria bacterium]|nr:peptidylprolyl isomerase [Candidatus Krumholzibacteria bacterium]
MSKRPALPCRATRSAGLLVLALGLAAVLSPRPARAQQAPELVDRILAIVDEEAILQSDLDREVELHRLNQQYQGEEVTPDSPELRREMLDRLIESKLIIAAAKAADMTVDDEAIGRSVDQRIQQYVERFGSQQAFERELVRSGTTLSDFKERMRTQLRDDQYLRLVVGKFIRPDIEVMENEVNAYYLAHLAEMPSEPDSVTIADIMVTVQPTTERRREIEHVVTQVRKALDDGRPFADVAAEFSRGPNAKRGGVVGVVAPGDLFDPALDRAVFALAPGEISDPVVSSRGVHILRVDAVQDDGRRAISQVFLPIEVTQEDVDLARSKIAAARQRVLGGEPFAAVAADVSEDEASAARGGLLGTFALGDLSDQFRSVLENAEAGAITEPVQTPAGWYVFEVRGRQAGHMYTYDELKDQLRMMVESQKIETALAKYVAGLRERFFVDEKI